MQFAVITLFPDMFDALRAGVTGRAIAQGLIDLSLWNPRDFTLDKHQRVDDRPFGGGPGMVMTMQPLVDTLSAAKKAIKTQAKVIYVSPQGKRFDQQTAKQFASAQALIFVAGRYEGIDQRFIDVEVDEEWSIGDMVVSGGELPAMLMIDSITRLLPGVLGDAQSMLEDSFGEGLLDCPHYTRPECYEKRQVPEVLRGGDHQAIALWRRQQMLGQTWLKRPDLLASLKLTERDKKLLTEFMNETIGAHHDNH